MEFLFGLLTGRTVVLAGAALALLLGYRFLADRLRVRLPAGLSSGEAFIDRLLGPGWAARKLNREVARLKRQANFLAAGKLLEEADRLPEAAEAYLEGQEYWAAASSFERLGRHERAAELFLQAGDYKKGAALLTTAGKPARAAALFLEKGNGLEAARLFGLAGQWQTAADLYEKGGYPMRAAEAWAKAGKSLKAAEAYEKHFLENVSYSTTYSATSPATDRNSALLAGQLYEKSGELERAASAYSRGSFHRQAAEAHLKLGAPQRAAELFLRAEDEERAAQAFEQAGETERAAMLRGEAAFKADKPGEAAEWFVKGRDFLRAAELFESANRLADAAAAYEAGESWAPAASVYVRAGIADRAAVAFEKAGDFENAAALYEKAGDLRKAAELYGRAGQSFKSGQVAVRTGDHSQAIAALQRVAAGDDNALAATELLAQEFIETGRPGLAIEKLRRAIEREATPAGRLALFYWLARAQEASGATTQALAILEQIQAEDIEFRDVAARLERLHRGEASPAPNGAGAASASSPTLPAGAAPSPAASAASAPVAAGPRFMSREQIGQGALGSVHRGEDTLDGRSVALRLIPRELLGGLSLQELGEEVQAAAQLSHPNLAKVIAWTECDGVPCVVSELVPGRTFAEAIVAGRRLGLRQVHALGRTAAQALAFVHGRGLVHGSVQPSNIMVASGVIKLTDLGLGRLARAHARPPSYHAPEGELSPADDLYGLCAVMYHLLTGAHPASHAQGVALPLPSQLAADVPEALDRLLVRGLHPRRELRLRSAEDLLRELREMVTIR